VSRHTTIAVREGSRVDPGSIDKSIRVARADSGKEVSGAFVLALDEKTVIFKPDEPFEEGTLIQVHVLPGLLALTDGRKVGGLRWKFTVSPMPPQSKHPNPKAAFGAHDRLPYVTDEELKRDGLLQGLGGRKQKLRVAPHMHPYGDGLVRPTTMQKTFGRLYEDGTVEMIDDTMSKRPADRYRGYRTIPPTFPMIDVTVPPTEGKVAEGFIFLSTNIYMPPWAGVFYPYMLILDSVGDIVYYKHLQPNLNGHSAGDTSVMKSGEVAVRLEDGKELLTFDERYVLTKQYEAGHGYTEPGMLDFHAFQVDDRGHYLVLIDDVQEVDMRDVLWNGTENMLMRGHVVQEIDPEGNVVFEWRSWDAFRLDELARWTQKDIPTDPGRPWDTMHMNSIDWAPDGHLVFSLRKLDGVIKVNRDTGDVMWRLFGPPDTDFNQFTTPFTPRVSHQHDVHFTADGTMTLFSNGNYLEPEISTAMEFAIDEEARVARLVYKYSDPSIFSFATGGCQKLDNGNMAIGWGGLNLTGIAPFYTEVTRDKEVVLQMKMRGGGSSYRVRKSPWVGVPHWSPVIVLDMHRHFNDDPHSLHYSWNGATVHTTWRVYAGMHPERLKLIKEHTKTRFEHVKQLRRTKWYSPHERCVYFQVEPVDYNGKTFQRSAVLASPACGNA